MFFYWIKKDVLLKEYKGLQQNFQEKVNIVTRKRILDFKLKYQIL